VIQGKSNQDDQRELQDAIATSEHHISFGKQDLTKLALAQATCSEFGITVTSEEVW